MDNIEMPGELEVLYMALTEQIDEYGLIKFQKIRKEYFIYFEGDDGFPAALFIIGHKKIKVFEEIEF